MESQLSGVCLVHAVYNTRTVTQGRLYNLGHTATHHFPIRHPHREDLAKAIHISLSMTKLNKNGDGTPSSNTASSFEGL